MTYSYTVGTSYFVSLRAAYAYYLPYGNDRAEVRRKIKDGEIQIGKPPRIGDTALHGRSQAHKLVIIPGEGRYGWEVQR